MQKDQSSRSIGNIGEDAVCEFLKRHGYEVVSRNFTIRGGEIDIIAEKNDILAFVEVKSRKSDGLTQGEEAVTEGKRRRIIKTAEAYLNKLEELPRCRFDVAVVTLDNNKVRHLKYYVAAFDASKK